MRAAEEGTGDRIGCEDHGTETTSARQLFSDGGRKQDFAPGVVARSMPTLRTLRRAHKYCDVTLQTIGGAKFWAHSFVLATRYAGCDQFFSGRYGRLRFVVESMPVQRGIVRPPVRNIVVSGLSSEMLELFIDIAYHVPIHERVGLHNVREVLDVAEALNIAKVRDHCIQLLDKSLNPENCIGTYQLALCKGYGILSSNAFHYMIRNFDKVWNTSPEFPSLTPDELSSMLYNDELYSPNEVECVFKAILKWIAGNVDGRRCYLPRLLPLIRFAFCSSTDIEKVESDPLVRADEQALEVLIAVKRTLSQEPGGNVCWSGRPDLCEQRWLKPRVPKDVLFMFGGWTSGVTNHLVTYNNRSSRWLSQPHQNTHPRAYHGVAILDGLIYFVGGFDGHKCYHTVATLDVSLGEWADRSNMQVCRCYVSLAVLQGYIYAMGGFDGEESTSSVERYDAKRNNWDFVASMLTARSDACAAAASGRIYIMGGYMGREVLNSVECYDPSVNAWSYVMSMSSPRSGLKAVVHEDGIFVLGGFDGEFTLDTAERMDVRKGHWSELPSMNFPRSNFVAVVLEGSIYVAGGFDGGTTVSLVERYDIQTRQWFRSTDLSLACTGAAGCVYPDIPNPWDWL